MNQLPLGVTPPAPGKRKRKKGSLNRSASGRNRKSKRVNAIIATFPADSPVPPTPDTVIPADTTVTSRNPITLSQDKCLRNRADYATRKCVKKGEEVTRLKDEQVELLEIQKNQREDAKVNNQLMNKLEKKLSTNEISSSKQAALLKGRATRLSTSLTNKN